MQQEWLLAACDSPSSRVCRTLGPLFLSLAPSPAFPLLYPVPDSRESKWTLVVIGKQKAGRMSLEFSREAHARHPKRLPASLASGERSMPGALVFSRKVRLHDIFLPVPSARRKSRAFFLFPSPGGTSDHVLGAKHLCMSMRFVCIPTPSCLKKKIVKNRFMTAG